jgi:hypothetical protein
MNLDIALAILTITNPHYIQGFFTSLKLLGIIYLLLLAELIALKDETAIGITRAPLLQA